MEETITRIKEFVKTKINEEEYQKVSKEIDKNLELYSYLYQKEIIIISTLFSKLDQNNILDYLQRFEIPLKKIEKIYDCLDMILK
jgi:hypothetical protein